MGNKKNSLGFDDEKKLGEQRTVDVLSVKRKRKKLKLQQNQRNQIEITFDKKLIKAKRESKSLQNEAHTKYSLNRLYLTLKNLSKLYDVIVVNEDVIFIERQNQKRKRKTSSM